MIIPKLAVAFTEWLRLRTVPAYCKSARIIPLSKEKTEFPAFGNIRTISILPIISKIFEKIMQKRLRHQLQELGGLNPA